MFPVRACSMASFDSSSPASTSSHSPSFRAYCLPSLGASGRIAGLFRIAPFPSVAFQSGCTCSGMVGSVYSTNVPLAELFAPGWKRYFLPDCSPVSATYTLPAPSPSFPGSPLGMVKLRMYFGLPSSVSPLGTTSTLASVPGLAVVTVPCSMTGGSPLSPLSPFGSTRFSLYFGLPWSSVPSAVKLPEGVSPLVASTVPSIGLREISCFCSSVSSSKVNDRSAMGTSVCHEASSSYFHSMPDAPLRSMTFSPGSPCAPVAPVAPVSPFSPVSPLSPLSPFAPFSKERSTSVFQVLSPTFRHWIAVCEAVSSMFLPSTPFNTSKATRTSFFVAPLCWMPGKELTLAKEVTSSNCESSFDSTASSFFTSAAICCISAAVMVVPLDKIISPAAIVRYASSSFGVNSCVICAASVRKVETIFFASSSVTDAEKPSLRPFSVLLPMLPKSSSPLRSEADTSFTPSPVFCWME